MRLSALATLLALPAVAMAGTTNFTAGNFVAVRNGDGTATLVNTGNAVFLDEITPAGTLVRSLPLPTTVNGAQRQCILSGTATSEGMITRSGDGSKLLMGCYGRDLGGTGSLASTTAAAVSRVVAVIGVNGSIDTSTALADAHSGNNIRSVASQDGSSFYSAGGNEGVRLSLLGASTSSVVSNTTATGNLTNLRNLGVWGGNLFVTNASGTNARLQQVGTGLPTAAGTQMAGVPGMPTDRSFYGYHFADRSTEVPGLDTLYVADDSAAAPGAGVLKYSLVGGTWVANGRVAMVAARGLAAQPGTGGYLIAVAAEADCATGAATAGSSKICGLLDTGGYNEAFTLAGGAGVTLATAPANTAFRGVANAPVASSAPGVLAVAPNTLVFGNQSVGSTSAAQTVTVSNTGGGSLTVGSLTAAAAPFALSGGTCTAVPITLAAGASCTLTYTFAPSASGAANQTLTVDAGAAGNGTVALSGTGIQGALVLPANVSFPTQPIGVTSAPLTVTLSNNGTDSLQVTALTAAAAPFARSGGSCETSLPFSLAPGANCSLSYTFTPAASGAAEQTISVTANAPGSGSFTLSGTGGASADLSISKTSNLGLIDQGLIQYALVVSNAGPSPVTGATVTDTFEAGLTGVTWTCLGINGAGCAGAGSGNLSQSVDLPVGGALYYSIVARTLQPRPNQFSNTASVAEPTSVTDPVTSNNSSTVVDAIGIFANGFEAVTQLLPGSNGVVERIELPLATLVEAGRSATPTPAARFDIAGNLVVVQVRRVAGELQAQLLSRDPLGVWQMGGWQNVGVGGLQLQWQTGAETAGTAVLSARLVGG